jgi:hypothetical protein
MLRLALKPAEKQLTQAETTPLPLADIIAAADSATASMAPKNHVLLRSTLPLMLRKHHCGARYGNRLHSSTILTDIGILCIACVFTFSAIL